jgi:hypothetical protein
MEDELEPDKDPGGAKLKAWLLTKRDGTRADIKLEAAKMSRNILSDWISQFLFALKMAMIGALFGGIASYFFSVPLVVSATAGFLTVGCIAFLSWIPGGRGW